MTGAPLAGILCDLCQQSKSSYGMRYVEELVRLCADCAAPPAFEQPYKRPWWLRFVGWLARL